MRIRFSTVWLLFGICLFAFSGCGQPSDSGKGGATEEHAHDDEHAHSDEGPHDGHIIELGDEDHHAELTHDDATDKVGVYILGSDAKSAAPIAAESVMINVSADGAPKQYTLTAVPQQGEADGQSSYFELESEELCDIVAGESEAKNVQARLSFKINDKPFVGLIETAPHDHDHGHEH